MCRVRGERILSLLNNKERENALVRLKSLNLHNLCDYDHYVFVVNVLLSCDCRNGQFRHYQWKDLIKTWFIELSSWNVKWWRKTSSGRSKASVELEITKKKRTQWHFPCFYLNLKLEWIQEEYVWLWIPETVTWKIRGSSRPHMRTKRNRSTQRTSTWTSR